MMGISFWTFISLVGITAIHHSYAGFYNIAHMTNNIPSIDWAIQKGANAIEIDLQFKGDGTPYRFFHSSTCDCSCMCGAGGCHIAYPNSVCMQLEKTSTYPCDANTDSVKLLQHAAKQQGMALIIIDSKLTDGGKQMSKDTLQNAGRKVITLIEENLYGQGYKGSVIIGATGFANKEYIKEISMTNSVYRDRIHFTIDFEEMKATKEQLDFSWNKNIVYNIGHSACSPSNKAYFGISKLSAINQAKGVFGMTYTWSVDLYKTMNYYSNYFNGIITNYPGILTGLLKLKGIPLAKPEDRIAPATSSKVATSHDSYLCECTYYSGGCKVTKAAPKGLACQCTYPFLWTCKGWVVQCTDQAASQCQNPGTLKQDCLEGRGDCGGY
ncbi:dermonecrotic toxin LiSicTox-betaID1-like [Clytia hemisphaerica]|uniref:Uncharacterized protein n=1 Tax=Clytia hemisphaerica TaxID=252671 RepID=A0A7M5V423_9CNID